MSFVKVDKLVFVKHHVYWIAQGCAYPFVATWCCLTFWDRQRKLNQSPAYRVVL